MNGSAAPAFVRSDGQECLGGGQAGGADGGQQPGQGADDDGRGQAASPGLRRDDDNLAVSAGVGGGGDRADDDSSHAAGQGQQDGFGQELGADLAAGGAQCPAQSDLMAAVEHRDDHDVGHPDRADQQRDRAQAEEQGVERALGVGLGGERVRGLGDGDLAGVFRVGLRAEQAVDGGGDSLVVRDGADVDLRRVAVEVQVLLSRGEADQDRRVDLGGIGVGVEDAGHIEPLAADLAVDPDPHPGPDPVYAKQPRCDGAEHGGRLAGGGGVQEPALREAGAGHRGQVQGGGVNAEGVGFDRRDERGLVDINAADGAGALYLSDPGQPGDHAQRRLRQFGDTAGEGLPVGDGQQVGAQGLDLGQQRGGRGSGQAQDGGDRRDADRDAQRRQPGAQLAGPRTDAGQPG